MATLDRMHAERLSPRADPLGAASHAALFMRYFCFADPEVMGVIAHRVGICFTVVNELEPVVAEPRICDPPD
ncbi:hypothetical protein EVAR_102731_1 [Eumeta japonica]|uniref:Uncharacterized protein n=1 Tax=Eumeta variegata TaxID=151549 RepID=A0A4C1TKY8_EUMVA|nr:hypothetical protein EVAR_102731_1 [Eumeta japonica]